MERCICVLSLHLLVCFSAPRGIRLFGLVREHPHVLFALHLQTTNKCTSEEFYRIVE